MLKNYIKFNTKLVSLGFNLFFSETNLNNNLYKKYSSIVLSNCVIFNDFYTIQNFFKLNNFFCRFFFNTSLFLFVSLSKNYFRVTRIYKFLQKKLYNYFVYDWIFGAVSNFKRIFKIYELRELKHFNRIPDISILIQTGGWTGIIINELKCRYVFCLGVVDPIFIKHLDYPIALPSSFESGFIIIDYFLRQFYFNVLNSYSKQINV